MDEICRLCASSAFVGHEIFGPEGELLAMGPFLFAPLQVRRDDGLPQRVCGACRSRAVQLKKFCCEAQHVQTRLRELAQGLSLVKRECSPETCRVGVLRVDSQPDHALRADSATQTEDSLWTNPATQTKEINFEMDKEEKVCDPSSALLDSDNPLDHCDEDTLCEPSMTEYVEPKTEMEYVIKQEETYPTDHDSDYISYKHTSNSDGHPQASDTEDLVKIDNVKEEVIVIESDSCESDQIPLIRLRNKVIKKSAKKPPRRYKARAIKDVSDKETMKKEVKKIDDSESDYLEEVAETPRRPVVRPPEDPHACWCCVCSQAMPSRAECLQHYEKHESEGPAVAPASDFLQFPPKLTNSGLCPLCSAEPARGDWLRHWAGHRRRPHYCSVCRKSFKHFRNFIAHGVQYHAKEKQRVQNTRTNFMCDLCSRKFELMKKLRRHRDRVHDTVRPLKPRCGHCAYQARSVGSAYLHLSRRHRPPGHLCPQCGKGFTVKCKLKRHMYTHAEEKPYKCRYCERGFAAPNTLTDHELTHTGERPHVCAVCSRGFTQRSALVTHMRSLHSRARPHACPHCGKGFAARNLLNVHLKKPCAGAGSGTDSD